MVTSIGISRMKVQKLWRKSGLLFDLEDLIVMETVFNFWQMIFRERNETIRKREVCSNVKKQSDAVAGCAHCAARRTGKSSIMTPLGRRGPLYGWTTQESSEIVDYFTDDRAHCVVGRTKTFNDITVRTLRVTRYSGSAPEESKFGPH